MVTSLAPERFDQVTEALKDVMDPELGVNVVDLGLIYDLGWDDEHDALVIHMTLTSAGCPLTDVLEEQTAEASTPMTRPCGVRRARSIEIVPGPLPTSRIRAAGSRWGTR